jgi:ribosomal protein S18 acetylase RimI-like enzyme
MAYPVIQSIVTPELRETIANFFNAYAVSEKGMNGVDATLTSFEIRREDGTLIACLVVQPFWGQMYIRNLFVEEPYRRQGYGRMLMEHGLEFARKQGCDFVFLESMNFQARNFYKKLGFQVDFVRHGYNKDVSYYYLTKNLAHENNSNIELRPFTQADISTIVTSFANADWPKSTSTFQTYWQEQEEGVRHVWVAHVDQQFAGYITLKWESNYKPFSDQSIPEIMDLNVLPLFRRNGVGARLLDTAEAMAANKTNQVGIGVGLYSDYGSAQRLYIKCGYIPDGRGVPYNYQAINSGSKVSLDDELVLWLVKQLK